MEGEEKTIATLIKLIVTIAVFFAFYPSVPELERQISYAGSLVIWVVVALSLMLLWERGGEK